MSLRIIFLLLSLGLFSQCSLEGQKVNSSTYELQLQFLLSHTVEEITVEKASKLKSALFLDARAWREYEVSHIENATWVGYDDFKAKVVEHIPKDQEIVVYCSVGYRSEKITEKLLELGFENVSNLYGGMFEWVNQEQPVVDEEGELTLKVHAFDKTWGVWLDRGEKVY